MRHNRPSRRTPRECILTVSPIIDMQHPDRQPAAAQCTLERFEREFAGRHLVHNTLAFWSAVKPDAPVVINADRKQEVPWRLMEETSTALAWVLLRIGFKKGDFLATSLPLLTEHIFLEYACFKIGVIHAPLDLRLTPQEVFRCLGLMKAKGFAFLGQTRGADFRELGKAVRQHCPFVECLLQFSPPEETIEGAASFFQLLAEARSLLSTPAGSPLRHDLQGAYSKAAAAVNENDGAQVIFTTGSTGSPKAALLSHRSITCQNMCLGAGFGMTDRTRFLVNLPASHVAGQSETLMTTLFYGGTAIILEIFDAVRSLQAIQDYRVTILGQIPAMFHLEWRQPDYTRYDLSCVELAVYGGQQVSAQFLERLATMAPRVATGLGLTEASGFCTYTPLATDYRDIVSTLGFDMPAYPMSIRRPMLEDGRAGVELPDGEVGHICFRGPQTFLGYVNDPEATARAISTDGFLYTGDMGYKDERGLHFSGRVKLLIKPMGYQVFPGDVENHICALEEKVASCGVVGAEHALLTEAIVAFVEKRPGAELSVKELRDHSRSLTSYMRPLHYVILEPGQMPLNRSVKVDYLRLRDLAREEIERLRAFGRWDR